MAIDLGRIRPYFIPPLTELKTLLGGNACGQTAMATVLTYFGLLPYDLDSAKQLYENSKSGPDVGFGVFGTSWERVRDVFLSYDMAVDARNSPRLTVLETSPQALTEKLQWVSSWVDRGVPVSVIVGNGEIDGQAGAHWGIVVEVEQENVLLANFEDVGGLKRLPINVFLKAWQAYFLPGVHFAAVAAYPR